MDQAEYAYLRRQWFPVARCEDVTEAKPISGRILDTDLVVFRCEGQARVAHRYCPHRGMSLALGAMVGGALECPYHGWRFDGSGRCVAIPSLPAGFSMSGELRMFECVERYGLLWATLDHDPIDPPLIPELHHGDWQLRCGEPVDLPCGIRQLTENFRDVAHFPFVHWRTMGPNVLRVIPSYAVKRSGRDLMWTIPMDLGGTAFDANRAVAAEQAMNYHLTLPSFSRIRTDFPDGGRRFTVQVSVPMDGAGEQARQYWFVAIDSTVSGQHGVSLDEMFDYERRIFEEDWPIVTNQSPKEAPLDLKGQAHTRADAFSVRYRRVYRELIQAGPSGGSDGKSRTGNGHRVARARAVRMPG